MKHLFSILATAGLVLWHTLASAQPGMGSGAPGISPEINAAMLKLFGKSTSFSSKAEMKVSQSGEKPIVMNVDMAVLEGKTRTELDMTTVKGMQLPPQAMAQMKEMGMDKMVSIVHPETQKVYMVYPNMKAYTEMAMPKEDAKAAQYDAKIEKEELGKETVNGRPTVKNKVTITGEDGKKHQMTVWNATDLKDFPVKFAMKEGGAEVEVLYSDIKLGKPEAKLFEPPQGYEKFDSIQAMMMKKLMGGVPQ